jgi:DNA-binding Lrp family transcriptional regulator
MLSLSKSEFRVIGFLIRNFSKRFTIRNIGSQLKISAAGAHSVLKKLEKNGVVRAEKLGTGLFYEINLNNKVAEHLAAASLLNYFSVKDMETRELDKECSAVVFDGKNALAITGNADRVRDIF